MVFGSFVQVPNEPNVAAGWAYEYDQKMVKLSDYRLNPGGYGQNSYKTFPLAGRIVFTGGGGGGFGTVFGGRNIQIRGIFSFPFGLFFFFFLLRKTKKFEG